MPVAAAVGGVPLLPPSGDGSIEQPGCEDGDGEGVSPEEASCLLNRLLFVWAFPIFWTAFRRGSTDLNDLPAIPRGDRPGAVIERLWRGRPPSSNGGGLELASDGGPRRARGGFPWLVWELLRVTRPTFSQAVACQAMLQLCSYAQPILLHGFLSKLSASDSDRGGDLGIALHAVGIAGAVMGMWIFAEYGWTLLVRSDLRAQVALSHLVYRKSLYLPPGSSSYTVGDLQNHFSTDCTKPTAIYFHSCHSAMWEAALTISMVAWHLTSLIGSAGAVAMGVIAAFVPVQILLSRRVKRFSKRIQQCRDTRGRLCHQFLSAMRVVKCFGLEETAMRTISVARDEELRAQWAKRSVSPFNNFIASTASLFGTIAAFTWMELVLDVPVDPAVAFTVLTWNNLLKSTLINIPSQIANILDAYVSIRRIEQLLECDVGLRAAVEPDAGTPGDGLWAPPAVAPAGAPHAASEPWPGAEGAAASPKSGEDEFVLEECDLGWALRGGGHRGVRKLSLRVRRGELLLVCGPIGSGKSVLLEGLAGTRAPLSGRRRCSGRPAAFVVQRPWLLNASVLDNVIFGRDEDAGELSRVLDAVVLGRDLQTLPDGLSTLVGEEGVQLSGGQKQRVSLARAVYSQTGVVLMDDVLSALDAHVGRRVWEEAVCGALAGRTRVLATHQVHYCADPAVNRILLLKEDGSVAFLGTYSELRTFGMEGFLSCCAQVSEQEHDAHGDTDGTGTGAAADGHGAGDREAQHREGGVLPESSPVGAAAEGSGAAAPAMSSSSRRGAAGGHAETRRQGAVLRADLVEYARACGGMCGVCSIAGLIVLYYGSQVTSSLQLAMWANANIRAEEEGGASRSESKRYLAQYMVLCLLTGVSCFSFYLGVQLVALRGGRNIHSIFMKSLLNTDLRFFDLTPTGRALNRCLKDMSTLDDAMPEAFRSLFESIMNCVTSTLILACFAWQALFAVPPFALAYWAIMTVYRWPARDLKRLDGVSRSPAMSHYSDTVRGASTIRAYQHEERFLQDNLHLLGRNQKTVYWFWVAAGWVSTTQEVLGTLLLAVIAAVVGSRASTGALSPGLAGLCLSYAMSMPRDLMWLSRRIANMEVEFVSIERIMEYARLPDEAVAHRAAEARDDASGGCGPDALPTVRGPTGVAVHAESLRFRYDAEGPWVLDGLSLEIPRGARAAVVGRTGCGKSSLLSALVRLYPTGGGGLFVHGRSVMQLPLPALRATVRVLLQDPIFFSGTIRSNLLSRPPPASAFSADARAQPAAPEAGDHAEEEALWNAVRQAGLEQLVRAMPSGLDARVEDSGMNFSQGERQLLCLARVLYRPPAGAAPAAAAHGGAPPAAEAVGPRVLLCDEPTASCDLATDERIHETLLRGLPEDWTLIVVCHRLHRIREFDLVFRVDRGAVAEQGPPRALLAPPGPGARGRGGLLEMCREQGVL